MITGFVEYNNTDIVSYNPSYPNHIENSYKVLGIKDKRDFIRKYDITGNTNRTEAELIFEWMWHNVLFYLDPFEILKEHTRSVDFGE